MIKFLDLGLQPLANNYLTTAEFGTEFKFNLAATFNPETHLVSLENFVAPQLMFNEYYAYSSSCSNTMIQHFKETADEFVKLIDDDGRILEIGSNDGVFIKNLNRKKAIAVEPCANFAKQTNELGYYTYNKFWNYDTAQQILNDVGPVNLVYSANCMCHIQDIENAFSAVAKVLKPGGIFIFEDPSMLDVIKNTSYDQFYDEHAHIFSIISLQKLLNRVGLYIYKVKHLTTHGGSNRIYCTNNKYQYNQARDMMDIEYGYGLDKLDTYQLFAERVYQSKRDLRRILTDIKNEWKTVIGYGATSKSTVVYNFCKLNNSIISYIIDTTPAKQYKYIPGVYIPIVTPPTEGIQADYAFLGAWNYKDEIFKKEKNRKFKFITHVPGVIIL